MRTKLPGRRHEDVTIETANGVVLFSAGAVMFVTFGRMPRSEQSIIANTILHIQQEHISTVIYTVTQIVGFFCCCVELLPLTGTNQPSRAAVSRHDRK